MGVGVQDWGPYTNPRALPTAYTGKAEKAAPRLWGILWVPSLVCLKPPPRPPSPAHFLQRVESLSSPSYKAELSINVTGFVF